MVHFAHYIFTKVYYCRGGRLFWGLVFSPKFINLGGHNKKGVEKIGKKGMNSTKKAFLQKKSSFGQSFGQILQFFGGSF